MVLWGYYRQWWATLPGIEEFVRALICGGKQWDVHVNNMDMPKDPCHVKNIHHAWFPVSYNPPFTLRRCCWQVTPVPTRLY